MALDGATPAWDPCKCRVQPYLPSTHNLQPLNLLQGGVLPGRRGPSGWLWAPKGLSRGMSPPQGDPGQTGEQGARRVRREGEARGIFLTLAPAGRVKPQGSPVPVASLK